MVAFLALLILADEPQAIGIGQAFSALWPIIVTMGGGYGGLIWYIKSQQATIAKQFEARIADKDTVIADLRAKIVTLEQKNDTFRDMAFDAVSGLKSTTSVIERTVAASGRRG